MNKRNVLVGGVVVYGVLWWLNHNIDFGTRDYRKTVWDNMPIFGKMLPTKINQNNPK